MKALRISRQVIALAAFAALGACSDNDNTDITNVVPRDAATIAVVSSTNNQSAVVNYNLANPVAVTVLDADGAPASGATVTWTIESGTSTLSAQTSLVDTTGVARVTWMMGYIAGTNTLKASIPNGQSVTLTATSTPDAFANIVIVSGDAQSVTAGSQTQAFVVRATDAVGNPVSGVKIAWATTAGTLSADNATTDASGTARVTLTTSSTPGAYMVTASGSGALPVTFSGSGT